MSGFEFERAIRPDPIALARLESSHADAVQAAIDLKESWKREDEEIAAARRFLWASIEQGARDRDAMRVKLGGKSLIEADARAAEAAAAARLKAADEAAAKLKADAKAKADAEKATADAAAKLKADAKAKADAEKATADAEAKLKADAKAKADAEKAMADAEAKKRAELADKAAADAAITTEAKAAPEPKAAK
jgi:colicin import membrane protein